ncbi:hypothetical protein ACET97_01905 [Aeromonas enteropelogenes]|uniref:hypothetical protein n=1 Tax=Aeromonas enteropelogenes TaxID=29489 RepID=UPI0038D1B311
MTRTQPARHDELVTNSDEVMTRYSRRAQGDEVTINRKSKAMFGAKVREVVIATNNEPMKITKRNGGISRRRFIFAFNNVVGDVDKKPMIGSKIATEQPVVIRHLLSR